MYRITSNKRIATYICRSLFEHETGSLYESDENAGQQMIRLSDVSARFSLKKSTKFPETNASFFNTIPHQPKSDFILGMMGAK